MMSENSSFHKFITLQSNITKRRTWLIILAFVTYLLYDAGSLPLLVLRPYYDTQAKINMAIEILSHQSPNAVITIVGSVILAIEGFQWLLSKQKSDFYESQPFSRNMRFLAIVVNSTFIIAASHFAASLLGTVIAASLGAMNGQVIEAALSGFGRDMALYAAVFSVSTLAVMLTGTIVVSVIAAAVLLVYEKAFELVLNVCISMIPTLTDHEFSSPEIFSPVFTFFKPSSYAVWRNLVCAVIAMGAAYLFYRYRKNEEAGKAVPLRGVRIVAKLALCFIISIYTGVIFQETSGTALGVAAMGVAALVIGAVIETVYNGDIRKLFKGMGYTLVAAGAAIALLLTCRADLLGYSRWVPENEDVESAYIFGGQDYESKDFARKYMELTDIDTVNSLLEIGEETVRENMSDDGSLYVSGSVDVTIGYRMKNGKIKERQLLIPSSASSLLDEVFKSDEFRKGYFQIYHNDKLLEDPQSLAISYSSSFDSPRYANSGAVYPDLLAAYEKDIQSFDYELACTRMMVGTISIDITDSEHIVKTRNLPVYESFTNTIEFLKSQNMYSDPVPPDEAGPYMYSDFYIFPDTVIY